VTLVSHERTCCAGLACDRGAVADPELLSACLDAALAEVVGLGTAHRVAATG
jgi:diacylglycerol O-acyltransferase / wax synthase